jgi:hypothetical protein
MSAGTLVPFMNEVALPGDTFDIDLDIDVKTHPTIGPLFGSYKVQLDVFQCPVRLYNGKLHMNMLNIGMKMQDIKLPQIALTADREPLYGIYTDNSQINPSCIFKYLGISGLGQAASNYPEQVLYREFNAIPYLAYWDIYKNYYANKQEEYGAVIHNPQTETGNTIYKFKIYTGNEEIDLFDYDNQPTPPSQIEIDERTYAVVVFNGNDEPNAYDIKVQYNTTDTPAGQTWKRLTDMFGDITWDDNNSSFICTNPNIDIYGASVIFYYWVFDGIITPSDEKPQVHFFPLENIDTMRMEFLQAVGDPNAFKITQSSLEPYRLPLNQGQNTGRWSKLSTQEGLGLKTYQSDQFNNWIQTDWIDGPNGINMITAVDTSQDYFTIDTLQLSRKVYDMLNRIAVSGGTYDDWLNAVYTHERTRSIENPVYMGGLIRELGFQEVISNAGAINEGVEQPLGTLAGRGVLTQKRKGGKIRIKCDEVSVLIGIVSLTPRIDYSNTNKWDINLKTMDDFHKPALDEIGFQSLISEQLMWQDTIISYQGYKPVYKEEGKQPAWLNYMTNVNRCYGNFADASQQMFMTLNRRYEFGVTPNSSTPTDRKSVV